MRMKETTDSMGFPLLLAGLLLWFLADAAQVRQAAAEGLALCAGTVIPSMFPFLVVSGLLISLGFGARLAPLLSGWMTPLFRLPGQAGSALVLGLLGGYPVGAKTAAELYRQGQLTRDEAQRLLTFCNNANPAFFLNVLGHGVFGSVRAGVWLLLIHLLAALLTGLLFRGRQDTRPGGSAPTTVPPPSFFPAFVAAVNGAAWSMLRICAFVVFFYTLASPLRRPGGRLAVLLTGPLELFSLTPLLTPDRFGWIAASAFCGWGGAGVLCQTAAVLEGSGLSVRSCARGKAVQGILSGLLAAGTAGFLGV